MRRKAFATPACPVCLKNSLGKQFKKGLATYATCSRCDLLFAVKYDDSFFTQNDKPESRADYEIYNIILGRLENFRSKPIESLLDFGCGRGDFFKYCSSVGIRSIGVDQNTEARASDLETGSFDAITLIEVIEHLPDPIKVFRELSGLLKQGGIIYLESTFTDSIDNPMNHDYVDCSIGHICIHSWSSLEKLGRMFGLKAFKLNDNVFILQSAPKLSVSLREF